MKENRDVVNIAEQYDSANALTPMAMIDRALTRGADVETLGKLMDLQERWQNREAKAAYDADMAAMQADLPIIEKKRTGNNWKYADWGDIKKEVNDVLTKHGFAVTHRTDTGDNHIVVTAICSHRDGHREETSLPLPFDNSGSKNAVQARGSTVQYGIRYTGCAILGIAITGEDKDGAEADSYDTSEWRHKIRNAQSSEELTNIARKLKDQGDIPQPAMVEIRASWSKRSKELAENTNA